MNGLQKLVKYFAVALACFLIVSIISIAVSFMASLGDVFSNKIEPRTSINLDNYSSYLDVDVSSSSLEIRSGDSFLVSSTSDDVSVVSDDEKIVIKEKKGFNFNKDNLVIVTVPYDYSFDFVSISVGVGKVKIAELVTDKFYCDMGIGSAVIERLNVKDEAVIDGGIGKIRINDGVLNNFNYDMGIGDVIINSKVTGKSEIDGGIGDISLKLLDSASSYTFDVSSGIGSVYLNGFVIKGDTVSGNGVNDISVSSGIGSIKIDTLE